MLGRERSFGVADKMIISFVGRTGQCKTMLMTATLFRDYANGLDVMSNYTLHFPKLRGSGKILPMVTVPQLLNRKYELENVSLAITELWLWLEARRSSSEENIIGTRLFLQSRKRKMNVYYDAQAKRQVDVRLQENSDMIALCQKYDKNLEPVRNPLWTSPDGFAGLTLYDNDGEEKLSDEQLFRMGPLFGLYDTNEIQEVLSEDDEEIRVPH